MNKLRRQLFVRCLEDRTAPATFTVLNLNDSGADSLRDCTSKANAAAGADTISFNAGLSGTITLTTGEMAISGPLTMIGPGSGLLTISGNNASRVFNTQSAATGTAISISGLTFTNATASSFGGAILAADEILTFDGCVFTGNKSQTKSGGAVGMLGAGNLTARDCTFSNNVAATFAGAIVVAGFANTTLLQRCTFSGNTAGSGGAMYIYDNLIMESCTLSGNSATTGKGGAIYCNASGSITQSTLSGNSAATDGGAVSLFIHVASESLVIRNSTITNNSASTGSGGGVRRVSTIGSIAIESSIISGNTNASAPDISSSGTVTMKTSAVGSGTGFTKTDQGGNLAFQPHANLKLGTLGDNGGPMLTHALFAGSPCLNVGSNPASLTTDQRGPGFARESGAADIGAFEVQLPQVIAFEPNPTILPPGATGYEFKVTYGAADGIKASSIGFGDVRVTGPSFPGGTGPSFLAHPNKDGSPYTVRYGINAPAGGFTAAHDGTYTVTIQANQVESVSGFFIPTGPAGMFTLTIQLRLTVDATNDERFDTDGKTSLREAFENANAKPGDDTITFSSSIFSTPQTIALKNEFGTFNVNSAVLTLAAPPAIVTIDAGNAFRHFTTSFSSSLSLSNLKFINGLGAISHSSTGTLSLTDVTFSNNNVSSSGGAIFSSSTTTLNVTNCTFDGNKASINGGAISWANGTVNIKNSTISNNSAGQGGGLFIQGTASFILENSTISGNTATQTTSGRGGGLAVIFTSTTGTVIIRNSTITNNTAKGLTGGGIHISPTSTNNILIDSTIVAGNAHPDSGQAGYIFSPDIYGPNSTDTGGLWDLRVRNSLIGILEAPMDFTINIANIIGSKATPVNAKLNSLANNGGPTRTHLPADDSPVVDKGSNPAGLTTDQRGSGFPRTINSLVDIGSVETGTPIVFVNFDGGPGVTTKGVLSYDFKLTYSSSDGINVATFDDGDLIVSGPAFPGGVGAKYIGVDDNTNGSPRTATYRVTAPAGGFTPAHNGNYDVSINAGQVMSVTGMSAFGGTTGSFAVNIPLAPIVDAINDEITDTDGKTSLREAIAQANAILSSDVIQFSESMFATPQTIVLNGALGELKVTDALTLAAPPATLTLNAGNSIRHFNVTADTFALSNLKFINGAPSSGDGGSILISSGGMLSIHRVTFSNNKVGVDSSGGAIANELGATVTITDCTFAANQASFQGGAIYSQAGTVTIRGSTFMNNSGARGGAILTQSNVTFLMENSTISGNTSTETTVSGRGGGMGFFGFATAGGSIIIRNSTITNNTANGFSGGGLHITQTSTNPIVIESTIIAGNFHPTNPDPMYIFSPDLYGPNSSDTSGNWNLTVNNSLIGILAPPIDFKSATGNITGSQAMPVDAKLGALGNNGGPTLTHALLADSPAINNGSNPAALTTDQRGAGFARNVNGVDIGGFEVQGLAAPPTVTSILVNGSADVQRSLVTSIKVSFSEAVNFPSGIAAAFNLIKTGFPIPVGLVFNPASGPAADITITFTNSSIILDPGGSLPDSKYTLTISADKITGAGGTLDGDGDLIAEGSPTDNKTHSFHRLFGDSNGDATVNSPDFAVFRTFFGLGASIFDFTADGLTNSIDFAEFRKRFGISLSP